jgi:hypothetical protein
MARLAPLTVWAFLPRRRGSTLPAADFCPGVRRPHDRLSPAAKTPGRSPEGKLDRRPRTTAGFPLCALAGDGRYASTKTARSVKRVKAIGPAIRRSVAPFVCASDPDCLALSELGLNRQEGRDMVTSS